MKPFNLEAFKAGQKALTREGRIATFIGINLQLHKNSQLVTVLDDNDYTTFYYINGNYNKDKEHKLDLVSMVSRHQALIDSYDPEDTWQVLQIEPDSWQTYHIGVKPLWDEERDYRIHPNNDLIKAFKSGKEIVATNTDGNEIPLYRLGDLLNPHKDWDDLRIKPKPEFTYPIYKQSKYSNVVVEFTDLTTGKVLVGNNSYEVDHVQSVWIPHTDAVHWQDWIPPEGWVDPVDKPKTKTIYEWMLKDEDGYWFTRDGLLTESDAIIEFSGYEYKKTGRSWEVEV